VQEACAVEGCQITNRYKTLGTLCTAHFRLYGGHEIASKEWSAEVKAAWSDNVKAASEKHHAISLREQIKQRERQRSDPKRTQTNAGILAFKQSDVGRAKQYESKRRYDARLRLAKNAALQARVAELLEEYRDSGGRKPILTADELVEIAFDLFGRTVASFDCDSLSDLSGIDMTVGEMLRKATSYTGIEPDDKQRIHTCISLATGQGLVYSDESLGHWIRKGTTQLMPDRTKIPKQDLLCPTKLGYKSARVAQRGKAQCGTARRSAARHSAARHCAVRHSAAQRGTAQRTGPSRYEDELRPPRSIHPSASHGLESRHAAPLAKGPYRLFVNLESSFVTHSSVMQVGAGDTKGDFADSHFVFITFSFKAVEALKNTEIILASKFR
jgi:hypothetical protein